MFAKAGHGGRLKIPLTLNEDPAKRQLSEILQQQWRSILAADVTLSVQETNFYWTETCNKKAYRGVAMDSWSGTMTDPYDFLLTLALPEYGCAAWVDKKYEAMLATANSTLNPAKRMRNLAEVEAYALRQMPLMPIYHDSWLFLQKPYIRGFPLNLLEYAIFKYIWIDTNWRPS